jgi:hypothetical protein
MSENENATVAIGIACSTITTGGGDGLMQNDSVHNFIEQDFTSFTNEKLLHDAIRQEYDNSMFQQYSEHADLVQAGIWRRTLYVTGVIDVTHTPKNIACLKRFFPQRYGPSECIEPTYDRNVDGRNQAFFQDKYNSCGSNKNKDDPNMTWLVEKRDVSSSRNKDVNQDVPALRVWFKHMDAIRKAMEAVENHGGYLHCPQLGFFPYQESTVMNEITLKIPNLILNYIKVVPIVTPITTATINGRSLKT